jgi:hypothetical protein
VCIPVPRSRDTARAGASETAIPRRPDRPADYSRYVLPVATTGSPKVIALDPTSVGDSGALRPGISISAVAATPVVAPRLEGQEGPVQVVLAGPVVGASTITRHVVRAPDGDNDYLVIIGNLDAVPALAPKTEVQSGAPLGKVGSSPVYLECRLLRAGVDPFAVPAERLLEESTAVAVDPRNLLELRN